MSRGRSNILAELRAHLPRGSRVLVAVSGGADSMALLHAVHSLARSLKLSVAVAHIDHGLREDSAKDALAVKEYAKKAGIEVYIRKLRAAPTSNIEAWARKERYSALRTIRDKSHSNWILTAHNANDVAETLLMRLVSNKEVGSIDRVDPKRTLLRPLLSVTRGEILNYLTTNKVPFVEDSSNFSIKFLRNRVRHRILPHFVSEFGEGVIQSLAWEGQRLARDLKFLKKMSIKGMSALTRLQFGSKEWLRALATTLKLTPKPLQSRLIQAAFEQQIPYSLGVRHAERVLAFILQSRASVELPSGLVIRRRGGGLVVESSKT